MKKFYLIAAAAAAVLAAGCAKNEVIQNQGPGDAVSFGVYVPKTVTKAGAPGQTTTASIQRTEVAGGGFGVFAYYTDDKTYTEAAAAMPAENKPNFMYNQGVFYNSTKWEYTPVKYWPNEYGTGANSTGTDRISFFAYAPYVSAANIVASPTYNITGMSANNVAGDPTITYVIDPTPTTAVDLCWAVNADTGYPWLNQTKQTIGGTVPFKFKHALARFNVNVRGWFDLVNPDNGTESGNEKDVDTKITIDNITISGSFYPSGTLNLNNTTMNVANWTPDAAASRTLTVRWEDLHSSLKSTTKDTKETTFPSTKTGVTKTNVNVFTGAAPHKDDPTYFTFIPIDPDGDEKVTLTVTITYYVTTQDAKLDGGISCVKNVITKTIDFDSFACGLNYNLNIVLGMTTVKLEATVDAWADPSNVDIDLPVNTAS